MLSYNKIMISRPHMGTHGSYDLYTPSKVSFCILAKSAYQNGKTQRPSNSAVTGLHHADDALADVQDAVAAGNWPKGHYGLRAPIARRVQPAGSSRALRGKPGSSETKYLLICWWRLLFLYQVSFGGVLGFCCCCVAIVIVWCWFVAPTVVACCCHLCRNNIAISLYCLIVAEVMMMLACFW